MRQKTWFFKRLGISLVCGLLPLAGGCDLFNNDDEKATTYTVSFSPGEGSGPAPAKLTVEAAAAVTLPSQGNMIAPEGKTFAGWKTGGGTVYQAGAGFTVSGDTVFTARWNEPEADNKTYIAFHNPEWFRARIYSDADRRMLFAEVPAGETVTVEAEPNPNGTPLYPVFLVELEGFLIIQKGEVITPRVDEKKVNKVSLPMLASLGETGLAYVKIENSGVSPLTFNNNSAELIPLNAASTIIMPGETAVYQIGPGSADTYRFMRNASTRIDFPSGVSTFEADSIYFFRYDGNALSTSGAKPLSILPAPDKPSVSAGNGGITAEWTAVEGADSYDVYCGTEGTPPTSPALTGVTGTSADIRGLLNDTFYYVWVRAKHLQHLSPLSEAAEITLRLAAPKKPSVNAENGSITVTWAVVELAGSYNVYYGENKTPPETPARTGVTETSAAITGLANGTLYYVWVRAVNSQGASPLSEAAEIMLRLAAPKKPSVNAENGSITVTWAVVELADSYNVYYGENKAPPETPALPGVTGTSAAITGLTNGTLYYVWVQAVNSGGASPLSEYSSGTPVVILTVDSDSAFTQAVSGVNASKETTLFIVLTKDITTGGVTFTANPNKTITIKGDKSLRSIANTGSSRLFTVPAGITLILENNIKLNGNDKGFNAVYVNGGTFEIHDNCVISGAKDSAVRVDGGIFTMKGGEISGNTASSNGGGVYVAGGIFTMSGGEISGNTAAAAASRMIIFKPGPIINPTTPSRYGGGVYVAGGTFTMSGGEISGNTAASSSSSYGGGVCVGGNGTFVKNGGGTISATNSAENGKAAYVDSSKQRNAAAGPGVNLDSRLAGSAGGWE